MKTKIGISWNFNMQLRHSYQLSLSTQLNHSILDMQWCGHLTVYMRL